MVIFLSYNIKVPQDVQISGYLSGRYQFVGYNGHTSDTLPIDYGVF